MSLQDRGVSLWNEWADESCDLGPVYSSQWRSGPTRDGSQIANVIESIRKIPNSRRHIVTAWNPAETDNSALPPCHALLQFYVEAGVDGAPSKFYQRSADMFLGVPSDTASYWLLTHIVAQQTDSTSESSSGPAATSIATTTTPARSPSSSAGWTSPVPTPS